jgi:hypothetical protein
MSSWVEALRNSLWLFDIAKDSVKRSDWKRRKESSSFVSSSNPFRPIVKIMSLSIWLLVLMSNRKDTGDGLDMIDAFKLWSCLKRSVIFI